MVKAPRQAAVLVVTSLTTKLSDAVKEVFKLGDR